MKPPNDHIVVAADKTVSAVLGGDRRGCGGGGGAGRAVDALRFPVGHCPEATRSLPADGY